MNRKQFLELSRAIAAGAVLPPAWLASDERAGVIRRLTSRLESEEPIRSEVRSERGGPRFFVNDVEQPPLFGLSTTLITTIENFREFGIRVLVPIVGMRSFWLGRDRYDWTLHDAYLDKVLEIYPDALLIPRMHLNTPNWWKEQNPSELIQYGLPTPERRHDVIKHANLERAEGGHFYRSGNELWEASFASRKWATDTAEMLRAYVRHVEDGPLASRVVGYFPIHGRTAEWNYYGSGFLPDYSQPMQDACGPVPSVRKRLNTDYGLLRDPSTERDVMEFYERFHLNTAELVANLCRTIKEECRSRVIVGTFFAYLLEGVRIQEGGYLNPNPVIDSPNVDFLACPYAYQNTNVEGKERWESDLEDGAGNVLGRARGVAGDGAFRAMVASLRQRGKLYISEIDPSTYLDASDSWRSIGGSGSKTTSGTRSIFRRDIGKVLAEGVGGWLYDFGPLHGVETGWFAGTPIRDEVRDLYEALGRRNKMDISSVAEIAFVCSPGSFFATRHWLEEKPWDGYGIRYSDLFNHWFINSQSRALHRIGAPVDYLYTFDLDREHTSRYRLLIFPNAFLLKPKEVDYLASVLEGSGATAVWYYAPALLGEDKIDFDQSTRLTGFALHALEAPGSLLVRTTKEIADRTTVAKFGVKGAKTYRPRFEVLDTDAEPLGTWSDATGRVAMASKAMNGWTSMYVGTAPLPPLLLRDIAARAGARLWSSTTDVVAACADATMVVAVSNGQRTIQMNNLQREYPSGSLQTKHELDSTEGDVYVFTAT